VSDSRSTGAQYTRRSAHVQPKPIPDSTTLTLRMIYTLFELILYNTSDDH